MKGSADREVKAMLWNTPITIEAGHRGLLFRDGRLKDVLMPGRHHVASLGRRAQVQIHNTKNLLVSVDSLDALMADAGEVFTRHVLVVETGSHEVAAIRTGKIVRMVMGPSLKYAFWREPVLPEVELIDVSDAPIVDEKARNALALHGKTLMTQAVIAPGETGLVYVDGTLRDELKPGPHAVWSAVRKVDIRTVDTRNQSLEVTAQEILTKDRVSIRVTLTTFWKVSAVVKAAEAKGLEDQLYRHVQFAIRDAVSKRTLDELLDARGTLDGELSNAVRAMTALGDLGVEVISVGVKDVILPGDMREILNRVVEAQKAAQANLIARQEETAATRSLLNTARLMENNPLLLRLKELESLERITGRVGNIDVSTGGKGLDELLVL